MKTTLYIFISAFLFFPSCTQSDSFDNAPKGPKTDPRDAVVGTYKYRPVYHTNPDYFKAGHPLPEEYTVTVSKNDEMPNGITISGIHTYFTIKTSYPGSDAMFFEHHTGVKIKTVSGYSATIVGTPDETQISGFFRSDGTLEYTLSLCGMLLVKADAAPVKDSPKDNGPN